MLRSGRLRRTLGLTVVALSVAVLPVTAVTTAELHDIVPSPTGLLVAAYEIGNLGGAATVMTPPLTAESDQLTRRLAVVVAAALAMILAAPTYAIALIAYAGTAAANAYFFASTLAARSEYVPRKHEGRSSCGVGALKIPAGSAGTTLAGAATASGPHTAVAAPAAAPAAAVASAAMLASPVASGLKLPAQNGASNAPLFVDQPSDECLRL